MDLKPKRKIILGIETSCDDTSVCLMEVSDTGPKILSLNSYNQDFLLAKWGGVVPELAARSHVKAIPPLMEVSFKEAGIQAGDVIIKLAGKEIGTIYDYMEVLGQHEKGQSVEAEFLRDNVKKTVKVTF